MQLNQTYNHNPQVQELLINIEGNRKALALLPLKPEKVLLIRKQSLLKSGIYSAAIEGNTLTPTSYPHSKKTLEKLEIQNLLNTLNWLYNKPHPLTLELVKQLHRRALHNLLTSAGSFRTEQSAVFNSAGVAIYLTPPPQEIHSLLTTWLALYQKDTPLPLIRLIISHYQFEKIHPFLDGNGRVGRLVTTLMLIQYNYHLNGLISLDEYLNSHKDEYYDTLNQNTKDITPFVEFFLIAINSSQNIALKQLSSPQIEPPTQHLSPRRAEILAVVRDHTPCSFDNIQRRFMAITDSTLHYDLQQLQKADFIKKLGTTRGVLYST